jgi:dihydrofolate reductase
MKLTVYMAISIDGLITRGENDSDWVSETDWEQFYSFIQANDAVIMGRKTMEQFGEDFPVEGPVNIVPSANTDLHTDTNKLVILAATPQEILELAAQRGLTKLLLIGGSHTNMQFLKAGFVDEIVLSVHPLVLGTGLHLFGSEPLDVTLELVSSKSINNELVQIVYKVRK